MGQKMVKKELEKAESFYNDQRFDEAVEAWKNVLRKLTKNEEKFHICGRICSALIDVGKFREALQFAVQQCELANVLNNAELRSEAYFHVAVCNERSCEFSKAISYCRQSQQTHPGRTPRAGRIQLCLGNSFAGSSEFTRAWTSYVQALDEAKAAEDKVLEILTSARMGSLFCALGDYENCLAYCNNSLELMGDLMDDDQNLKHKRMITVYMVSALRKLGRYSEAMDSCEDAMQAAMRHADRPVQARCLFLFADIHRKRNDLERANPRYESAASIMSEIGDRLGHVEVLGGMAKAAVCHREYSKAVEINEKALDLATQIGCKLEMLRCHARLQLIGELNKDEVRTRRHVDEIRQLVDEMDLLCGVCGDVIGQTLEKLDPLPCGHFVHVRCTIHLTKSTLGRPGKRRPCPSCRRRSPLLETSQLSQDQHYTPSV